MEYWVIPLLLIVAIVLTFVVRARASGVSAQAEHNDADAKGASHDVCPSCGRPGYLGEPCPDCRSTRKFSVAVDRGPGGSCCPACDGLVDAEDRFCRHCGIPLGSGMATPGE